MASKKSAAKKLATYRAKRNFSKTAEPRGKVRIASAPQRRFVIQKHDARRLHYDLRLELNGVFKSWAVTKGPSLDPHDKRLAVEVEDHPLDYGDFEGTIPHGQYGGGTVQIWDRGHWFANDPEQGLKKGDLKFALEGEKLHGEWVLVRMKHDRTGGKRINWLLIKHRDSYAKEGPANNILDHEASVASGRSISQIAKGTGKSPEPFMLTMPLARADTTWDSSSGFAADARMLSGTRPSDDGKKHSHDAKAAQTEPECKNVPPFIAPQLCTTAHRPPASNGWVHEVKFDGYRMQLRVENHNVVLITRTGLDWTGRFPTIARKAGKLPDAVIDGEIVALNHDGKPNFSALQAALSDGDDRNLIFFAFDLLFLNGDNLRRQSLITRKRRLRELLDGQADDDKKTIRYVEHFEVDGQTFWKSACAASLEGVISKRADAPYHSGRTGDWIKTKCRAGHEVVIGGWKSKGGKFRSLIVGVYRGKHLTYTGIVGTGYGGDIVKRIMPALKAAAAKKSPFAGKGAPSGGKDIHWLKPTLVAEIEFAGWTRDSMVRQAAFKGLRADKPAGEVKTEDNIQTRLPNLDTELADVARDARTQRNTKARGKRGISTPTHTTTSKGAAVVMGVTISKPDKELWPDAGDGEPVTKRDLANYMTQIGEWMLPHIAGRPCSVLRAPDGIGGETFFQRHATAHMSNLIAAVKVSGDRKPYIQIDRIEGLVAVAQTAGLELHPWNCAANDPQVPGRLVFDLDPAPEVDFFRVIAAAKEMKDRLAAFGLNSFCKTTGGKGLHIVVPLLHGRRDTVTWQEAKTFAHNVCQQMAGDAPNLYLVNMSKRLRERKIFLDYLRNDRMSTAIAPLSPRARKGATVSMPVTWAQVKAGLNPAQFTVRTAPDLINTSKAWRDYDEAARSLKSALKRAS